MKTDLFTDDELASWKKLGYIEVDIDRLCSRNQLGVLSKSELGRKVWPNKQVDTRQGIQQRRKTYFVRLYKTGLLEFVRPETIYASFDVRDCL